MLRVCGVAAGAAAAGGHLQGVYLLILGQHAIHLTVTREGKKVKRATINN
jgi:hypothetical protein